MYLNLDSAAPQARHAPTVGGCGEKKGSGEKRSLQPPPLPRNPLRRIPAWPKKLPPNFGGSKNRRIFYIK